ncbi:hypothetical protein AO390_04035 [Pseudomonas marginalis ICMP 11289]|nr:hypothetical protein AO390_04035 [Pseudomonas marginalis ICMP 11289]
MSVYFPASLIQATKVVFQGRISGYLLDARPVGAAFKAAMFFDIHQRSENGDTVVTDDLAGIEEEHGYSIAMTVRGERYVIVSLLMFMTERVAGGEETVVLSMSRGFQSDS